MNSYNGILGRQLLNLCNLFFLQVSKLSSFIDKTLGSSVRRIVTKMFKDELLVKYSLLGFKQKNNFSNLLCYHLITGKNYVII